MTLKRYPAMVRWIEDFYLSVDFGFVAFEICMNGQRSKTIVYVDEALDRFYDACQHLEKTEMGLMEEMWHMHPDHMQEVRAIQKARRQNKYVYPRVNKFLYKFFKEYVTLVIR